MLFGKQAKVFLGNSRQDFILLFDKIVIQVKGNNSRKKNELLRRRLNRTPTVPINRPPGSRRVLL